MDDLTAGHPLHRRADADLGGLRVRVRPVLPFDALALSRRMRDPTESLLRALVDVDHRDRETLIAEVRTRWGWRLAGGAHYARSGPDRALVMVVVYRPWRGRGLGGLLAQHLARAAREEGIGAFVARVPPTDVAAIHLTARLGLTSVRGADGEAELVCRLRAA